MLVAGMAFLRRSKSSAIKPLPAWEPIVADVPLPQQVITLQVTNPLTNQVVDHQITFPAATSLSSVCIVPMDTLACPCESPMPSITIDDKGPKIPCAPAAVQHRAARSARAASRARGVLQPVPGGGGRGKGVRVRAPRVLQCAGDAAGEHLRRTRF